MTYVLVCGGRSYKNTARIYAVLDSINRETPVSLLITGGAVGVDSVAARWAEERGVNRCVFPANWKGKGKAAGPMRNQMMLTLMKPTLLVAFPGGTGTADMIQRGMTDYKERGLPLIRRFDDVRELPPLEIDRG